MWNTLELTYAQSGKAVLRFSQHMELFSILLPGLGFGHLHHLHIRKVIEVSRSGKMIICWSFFGSFSCVENEQFKFISIKVEERPVALQEEKQVYVVM